MYVDRRPRWLVVFASLAVTLLVVGCGERKKKKPVNLFSERPKIDYSQVKVDSHRLRSLNRS